MLCCLASRMLFCSGSCRAEQSVVLGADQETATWVHLPVPEGDKDESADSGPAQQHMIQPDDYTLFTELSRPMPDYALEHVFAQHGPIEWVSSTRKTIRTMYYDQQAASSCQSHAGTRHRVFS